MKNQFDRKRRFLVFLIVALFALSGDDRGVRVSAVGSTANKVAAPPSADFPVASGSCQDSNFALFEGPNINDIGIIDPGCTSVISAIRTAIQSGQKPLTSNSFYFLSELKPFLAPNYSKLPCFLKAVKNTEFGAATLVINDAVTLSEPLVLPSRYTLAGTGIDGAGTLRFTGLANGVAAIRFDSQATNITIRDISVGRLDGGINVGIDVSRANKVFIRDVLVTGFFAGIYGSRPNTYAISVYIERCSVFQNDYNIVLHRNAFHWRIHDCILSQARCVGLRIFGSQDDPAPPPANGELVWGNDHLITGSRIEGCGNIGALLGSDSAMLNNNRFEQNGGVGGIGIKLLPTATRTRLFSNIVSGNSIVISPGATGTQSWGNMVD